MRRLISSLLAFVILANLAAWPAAVLAEALEHDHEITRSAGADGAPIEPASVHCAHGCAGHYNQHFQWQAPVSQALLPAQASSNVAIADDTPHPQNFPAPPFRPPLQALIRS